MLTTPSESVEIDEAQSISINSSEQLFSMNLSDLEVQSSQTRLEIL